MTNPTPEEIEAAVERLMQLSKELGCAEPIALISRDERLQARKDIRTLLSAVEQARGMRRALEVSELRDLWKKHGGGFFGPNVEHASIEYKAWIDFCNALSSLPPDPLLVDGKTYKELYYDLLFCVGTKHPNENRHETAKRYITEREERTSTLARAATGEK